VPDATDSFLAESAPKGSRSAPVNALPTFRYHPDPLTTGEVEPSDSLCESCGQIRGYRYTGPTYASEEIERLCPWCIADGSAAIRFEAWFTETYDAPDDVPPAVVAELLTRTPGFKAWQQEYWLFHCRDAAAFLGRVGYRELRAYPEAQEMLLREARSYGWSAEEAEYYVQHLDAEGDATGYLFRCLHCGTYLAYSDMS
jgi:uncharacterized protein CbrC (UPF0167 family)